MKDVSKYEAPHAVRLSDAKTASLVCTDGPNGDNTCISGATVGPACASGSNVGTF